MGAAIQLAVSTYASYVGEQVYYGDWLKVSQARLCDSEKAITVTVFEFVAHFKNSFSFISSLW